MYGTWCHRVTTGGFDRTPRGGQRALLARTYAKYGPFKIQVIEIAIS